MADLITEDEMALWCQTTTDALSADPFAAEVRTKVSEYLCFIAEQPTWSTATAPIDVRMLAIRVVRRTYVNPDQEKTSSAGPISATVLDEAALASNLTDAERKLLEGYRGEGLPGDLWVASIGGAQVSLQPTVYVSDTSQTNLGTERPWMIPYLDINDVAIQDEDFE